MLVWQIGYSKIFNAHYTQGYMLIEEKDYLKRKEGKMGDKGKRDKGKRE